MLYTIHHMTPMQVRKKHKRLVKAFVQFKKRYLDTGEKPNIRKQLPEMLYHTMRLGGEKITRREAYDLFKEDLIKEHKKA